MIQGPALLAGALVLSCLACLFAWNLLQRFFRVRVRLAELQEEMRRNEARLIKTISDLPNPPD